MDLILQLTNCVSLDKSLLLVCFLTRKKRKCDYINASQILLCTRLTLGGSKTYRFPDLTGEYSVVVEPVDCVTVWVSPPAMPLTNTVT